MTFHVGQKVVCVDDAIRRNQPEEVRMPTRGHIYTIRSVRRCDDGVGIWIEEIINPPCVFSSSLGMVEPVFDPRRFRPIVERKTDISIFTAMLKTEPVKENLSAG